MAQPMLELRGICKRFPGAVALDGVSLTVAAGEVVALIGENGAGKSTLMRGLGGIVTPDAGEIRIDAQPVSIRSPAEATALGIGFVHQELNVLDNLDVAGNVYLGREPTWAGPLRLIDRSAMARNARTHLARLGLDVDPGAPLLGMSLGRRQLVEIAKALSQNARLLILDEPTSSLTAGETSRLLAAIHDLRGQGVSVIYISHRLGEIREIADRVVALRDGRNAGELPREQISHDAMVRLMIGRPLQDFYVPPAPATGGEAEPHRLDVRDVRTAAWPGHAVSFSARGGEIVGVAGLVGAGRSELAQAIFGADRRLAGEVLVDSRPVRPNSPRAAIAAGIGLVPEDRRRLGLLGDMNLRENISLAALASHARLGLIDRRRESAGAWMQMSALAIKAPSPEVKAMNLSGGNQQKAVLAKWLSRGLKALIVDEPTRGIDVGARAEIYRLLRRLSDAGTAVVAISSDLEEALGISDRILVMREGAIAGELSRDQFSEQAVMRLAFGTTAATSPAESRSAS